MCVIFLDFATKKGKELFSIELSVPICLKRFKSGYLQADSIEEFAEKLAAGVTCHFSIEPSCEYVVLTSWMYILGNCLNLLFQFLLTRHGEGSVYPTVVSAIGTPLSALFWTVFTLDPFYEWSPTFNETTLFIFGGLAIMIPAVVCYNIFSITGKNARDESPSCTTNKNAILSDPLHLKSKTSRD